MPRTARTDPYEPDCAVKGCRNVVYKHDFCRPHYSELAGDGAYLTMAVEMMTYAHNLGRKRARELRRNARTAGYTLLSHEAQMLTAPGRAAHEARVRGAA
jgi:hypothetical protein